MNKSPFISTLVFAGLSFIPAAAGIFLLPLYLKELDPDEYAILSLVGIFAGLVAMFANLKLDAAMRTFYFDYEEESPELITYLKQIFSLSSLCIISVFILMLILGEGVFSVVFKSEQILFYPYGLYALAAALLNVAKTPYMIYLKNQIRLKEFALYQLGEFGLILGLQAYFVLELGRGLVGILEATLIAQSLIFLVFIILNHPLFTVKFNPSLLLPSLKYSFYLLPFILMNWFIIRGDRILFEQLSELHEVGKYALLMTIIGLSRLLFNALDNAIRPFLFTLLKKQQEESFQKISSLLIYYISISCLFLSGLVFVGNLLPFFTDKTAYLEVVPLFSFGALIVLPAIYIRIYNLQLVYRKKSTWISGYSIISFVILIAGFFLWVPQHGILGAMSAIGLSNLSGMFIFGYIVRSKIRDKTFLFPGIIIVAGTIAIILGAYQINRLRTPTALNVELIQFPVLVLLVSIFSLKDIKNTFRIQ